MEPIGDRNIPIVIQNGICGGIVLKLLDETGRYGKFSTVQPGIALVELEAMIRKNNKLTIVREIPSIVVNSVIERKSDGFLVLYGQHEGGHVIAFIINDAGELILYEPNSDTQRLDKFRVKADATPPTFLADFQKYISSYAITAAYFISKTEGGRRKTRKRKTRMQRR